MHVRRRQWCGDRVLGCASDTSTHMHPGQEEAHICSVKPQIHGQAANESHDFTFVERKLIDTRKIGAVDGCGRTDGRTEGAQTSPVQKERYLFYSLCPGVLVLLAKTICPTLPLI
jgi:hypothetical protein